jgi:GYF domain 2
MRTETGESGKDGQAGKTVRTILELGLQQTSIQERQEGRGPRPYRSAPRKIRWTRATLSGMISGEKPDWIDAMQIHLSKPGGKREGPFSLEQINADLAAHKYTGSDYWAWHEGLPEWVPLYSLPGVRDIRSEAAAATAATQSPGTKEQKPEPGPTPVPPQTDTTQTTLASLDSEKLPSGMPSAALEHSFLVTSGDGPSAARSSVVQLMLQKIVGGDLQEIQGQVTRDVIGQCNILEGLKGEGSIPGVVWKKMASIRPELLQQAREGIYRICIRSFRIETGDVVSVFLFYNKRNL